jgi:hypothetical protein
LFAVIGVILLGLYRLIRRVSTGMFLQKFVVADRNVGLPEFEAYATKEGLTGDAKGVRLTEMQDEIGSDLRPWGDEADLDQLELQLVRTLRHYEAYFAAVLESCNPKEKYLLFQFACNGFLNYKNIVEIDDLLERGVLVVRHEEVRLFSRVFRAYILTHVREEELEKSFIRRSPWQRFKVPFLILMMIAAAFLFFTRQEAWQRISALIAALSSSLGLLGGLFKDVGDNSSKPS